MRRSTSQGTQESGRCRKRRPCYSTSPALSPSVRRKSCRLGESRSVRRFRRAIFRVKVKQVHSADRARHCNLCHYFFETSSRKSAPCCKISLWYCSHRLTYTHPPVDSRHHPIVAETSPLGKSIPFAIRLYRLIRFVLSPPRRCHLQLRSSYRCPPSSTVLATFQI